MCGCSAGHGSNLGKGYFQGQDTHRRPVGCLRDVRAIKGVLSRYSAKVISVGELGRRTRKRIRDESIKIIIIIDKYQRAR